ncbi:MAG: Tetratricopeptide 2 repeat-containing protein [Gemmatimonadetes bacterium]|nr:Tetratricopeptide 2 repeat-containing protein [Gemmatimonadota bacterium]
MPSLTRGRYVTPLGPRPYLDRGLRYEQAGLTEQAIDAYESAFGASVTPVERAEAHIRLARVQRTLTNWEDAIAQAREAVRLADVAGNADVAAEAMNVEVGVHQLRGDFAAGERLARVALGRAHSPRIRGMLLQNLGVIAAQRHDYRCAERLFSESVEAFKAARYELGMAIALNNASAAARDCGDFDRALEVAILATEVAERIDALDIVMLARQNQAHALLEHGSIDRAEVLLGEALGHYAATGNLLRHAECLEIMGRINEWRPGYLDPAVRCYRRAAELAVQVSDRVLAERLQRRLATLGDVAPDCAGA